MSILYRFSVRRAEKSTLFIWTREPKLEGMSWRKILSQHDMRSAEAYPHGYDEV